MKRLDVVEKVVKTSGLAVLLAGMGFQPCLASRNVVAADAVNAVQQNLLFKGKIVDKAGEGLPGTTVRVINKTQGAVTDLDGNFSLEVAKGDKLEVSFIGYVTKVITVGNENNLVIVLEEDSKTLDEVVVVGYGTQKKVNLTGAVASVSSDVLESRPITNLSQGLQGMIGNLNISASNGSPGKGYGFNVRGTTSVNSAGPLVLVDGVQMDPNLINPADVESVSVLKDAASASIYGTQAAYGVVLITTKKGKDQHAKVSFSGNWSLNSPTRIPEYMDSWTFANFHNLTNRNSGGGDYYDQNYMDHIYAYYTDPKHNLPVFIDPSNPDKYLYCGNTDWIEETRKTTTLQQQYTLSINGGSGKTTYYGSIGMMDQEGQLKHYNDGYQRFNVALNVNSAVRDWLKVGMKMNYNHTKHDAPFGTNSNNLESAFYGADLRPFMPVYHPDGNYSGQGSWTNMAATQALSGSREHKENDLWLTGTLNINPLKGWNINMDYTFNMYMMNKKYHGKEITEHYANPEVTTIFPHITPSSVKFTITIRYSTSIPIMSAALASTT